MPNGFVKRRKQQWTALITACREGRRVFDSLLRPPKPSGSFEPLTPVLLADDQFELYERELKGALNNDEILNIALTGGYGAGKSSVIKTFFDRHPEFQTAYVSLATFSKDAPVPSDKHDVPSINSGGSTDAPTEGTLPGNLIARIEETIVQQLLYAVPAERLPKTRLKRIVQASSRRILMRTVYYALFIIGGLRLYLPTVKELPAFDPDWIIKGLMFIPGWLAVAVVGIGCLYALYASLKFLSMFSIDGLTLKGGKLEAMHHGSVLHKNVDEIIYCFERSDIRVVVIEDLDRFGAQEVFFRLREINFTIRHSPQIKRPVHFIYAIRDELFTVTDKTKFFDIIIPVIPVVNSENSREKLYQLMGARTVNGQPLGASLDRILVETVCYYIDEMRLIKNIVNEYDIFANLLSHGGLELDQNKLFANVVIRNLHPEEFALLSRRRGRVHSVLTGLSEWLKSSSQALIDHLEELREERSERLHQNEEQLVDARLRVWHEALKASGVDGANYIQSESGQRFSLGDFLKDEIFEQLCQARQWQSVWFSNWSHQNPLGIAVSPKDALAQADFKRRENRIQTPMKALEEAIRAVERDIIKSKTLSFREAARGDYGTVIAKQLMGMEVIVYLLRSGYLDTDYTDYLGFFYEGSLTHDDQNLLLALRRRAVLDVATPIRNPERVIAKLEHDSLDGGGGIIAALIAELSVSASLSNLGDVRTQKLEIVLRSARQHLDRFADAARIILAGEARSDFIRSIFAIEPRLFTDLLEADQFSGSDIRIDFICGLLDNLTQKQIEGMEGSDLLLNIIEELTDAKTFISGMETNASGWAWLRHAPVKFRSLESDTDEQTLRRLVEWSCLELNLSMMLLICRKLDGEGGNVSFRRLLALNLVGLEAMIERAPREFVLSIMEQAGAISEDSDSLKYVLSLINEDPDLQDQLFQRIDCTIEDLSFFPDNIWIKALQLDRLASVPRAAWAFFDHMLVRPTEHPNDAPTSDEMGYLEDVFADFITRNAIAAQQLWAEECPENDDLKTWFVVSDLYDDDTLEQLFVGTSVGAAALDGAKISPDRWRFLAVSSFVPFDAATHMVFANQGPDIEIAYLRNRWETAREELELLKLDPYTVASLSEAPNVPIGDVVRMWEGLVEREVASDAETLKQLGNVCARANSEGAVLSRNCLSIIVSLANAANTSEQERKELLLQALKLNLDWAITSPILVALAGGYGHLAAKKRSVRLPNSSVDAQIANALQLRGFVGKINNGKNHIEAFSRPSGMI
ncbi:hypothetical protein [Pseudomonas sp. HMWF006]|uniref:YobI family P-loop NTPase n=1 Tax=Pseudomonas sp. HMWF006 TaxID=2056843 RepID=UPI000D3F2FC3|nr:hypothetical protein [Pseudomonas sp. HMWF006]PTT00197.1 hypothetical protein DBR24_11205 [Pseudomonas sp. HMWF006]PTT60169.1 hypothetical protein DBR26_29845 [Pseudomonas sp. HMWF007]PTT91068.1 hypothetical protein DBR29_12240 [Pseudomonas sp. HMWF005]